MKKPTVLILAGCLLTLGISPANARRPKRVERTATASYNATQQIGLNTPIASAGYPSPITQEIAFPSQAGEKYVSIVAKDASAGEVYFFVSLSPDVSGPGDGKGFRGGTEEPLRIGRDSTVYVWMWQGTCGGETDVCVATQGTFEATFSNIP